MSSMPTVADERAEALGMPTAWRRQPLVIRGVLFLVTCLAVAFLLWICELLRLPRGFVAGALSFSAAEWLIRRHRFFHSGIDEGLWLAGTFAFIFGLPSEGRVEAFLVFAAAAALSGWRTRNEVFGAAAAVLVVVYAGEKWDGWIALIVAAVFAIGSALALQRMWQRRTTHRLFAAIALVAPLAGYLTYLDDGKSPRAVAAWMFLLAAFLVLLGIRHRDRVLLISGTLAAACGGFALRELIHAPVEAKLIAAGLVIVATAAVLTKRLRARTAGFVLTADDSHDARGDALQLAGTFTLAPQAPAPHEGGPQLDAAGTTDASFGGAGAGGGY